MDAIGGQFNIQGSFFDDYVIRLVDFDKNSESQGY